MESVNSKVTCPKCGETFVYKFIPGVSLDSVRLGNYRFMKCQKCGRWSFFNIIEHLSTKQRNMISVFNIFFGIILATLSGLSFARGMALHNTLLQVVGVIAFVFSLFLVGTGFSARSSNKEN